jgi:chromosomal replication initiator protein
MNADQAWQATLGQLQMDMSKASYDTWVKNSQFIGADNGKFTIGVQNTYARDWLDTRLTTTINQVLSGSQFCCPSKETRIQSRTG